MFFYDYPTGGCHRSCGDHAPSWFALNKGLEYQGLLKWRVLDFPFLQPLCPLYGHSRLNAILHVSPNVPSGVESVYFAVVLRLQRSRRRSLNRPAKGVLARCSWLHSLSAQKARKEKTTHWLVCLSADNRNSNFDFLLVQQHES